MTRFALVTLLLISGSLQAECIFVNLNGADQEINYCKQGLMDKAARTGQPVEELIQIDGIPGDTPDSNGNTHSNTFWALDKLLRSPKYKDRYIDCIVISGEDGSGHFFGGPNNFYAADLRALYKNFPRLQGTLNSSALWGCYPTSVHGAETHWVKKIPAMQFAMGFTIQGPSKEREVNWDLMRQFCDRREDAAKATTMDALCEFYGSLRQLTTTSLGLCNRLGVASADYAPSGSEEKCFTYDELKARCTDFIQNFDEWEDIYEQYEQGLRDDFETSPGGGLSDLRKFYNQVQLWRHCQDGFKTARGYDMPYAPDIIRLVKTKKVMENLMKMNGPELRQFDIMLNNLGLGAYRLGDLTKLPRRELLSRIRNAVSAIEQIAGGSNFVTVDTVVTAPAAPAAKPAPAADTGFLFGGNAEAAAAAETPAPAVVTQTVQKQIQVPQSGGMVNGIDTKVALRMAQCFRMTFETHDFRCTPFSMVGDNPGDKSVCIMNYERAHQRYNDDPC